MLIAETSYRWVVSREPRVRRPLTHIDIHPVWRPKYRFVKHNKHPINSPRMIARGCRICFFPLTSAVTETG